MSNAPRFRLTPTSIAAFLCLTLLFVEAHEQVHALATRLLCGGWADRVFDNVLPYAGCSRGRLAVVDIAAPLFSYAWLWIGAALMMRGSARMQAIGFNLLFANLPLGRLLPQVVTAFVAGSTADEYAFVRRMAGDAIGRPGAGFVAALIALAFTVPPLVVAWRHLPAPRRARLFTAFYTLPLLFLIAWLVAMNALLAAGVLATPAPWPYLVIAHTALAGALLLRLRRRLPGLNAAEAAHAPDSPLVAQMEATP